MERSFEKHSILEEINIIDDGFLDIAARTFKFDHEKGLAEWIKNSADAYLRIEKKDDEQFILLRFTDGKKNESVFECIDFCGMTKANITLSLKRWGDPKAAKWGKNIKTYGGHGNGGKFYMREMFARSYFITYKDGLLNIFGFKENKKYGFVKNFDDKKCSPEEAFKIANIENLSFPDKVKSQILNGETGFTVVKGVGPKGMPNIIRVNAICQRLRNHPQVRRLIKHIPLGVIYNDTVYYKKLESEPLVPLPGFELIEPIDIPDKLTLKTSTGELKTIELNKKYPKGVLRLYTSQIAMEGPRYGELNRIDFIGELGVVASYEVQFIPNAGSLPQLVFIYGECECQALEDPDTNCVQNDRIRLVDNDISKALLLWVGEQIRTLVEKIAEKDRKEQEKNEQKISSLYNAVLDKWKNRFMSKVFSTIFVGPGEGPGGGNGIGGSLGAIGSGNGNGGKSGGGTGNNPGGGDKEKRGPKYPRVLLSSHDPDPLSSTGESCHLSPRQAVTIQRVQDVKEGIYWINTSSPLASSIISKYGTKDPRWRDYLLQRYVDIFIQEALAKLAKQDDFSYPRVDQVIRDIIKNAQTAAAEDLNSFLFDESYNPNGA